MHPQVIETCRVRPTMPYWHADWCSLTVKAGSLENQEKTVWAIKHALRPIGAVRTEWQEGTGRHGYTHCINLRDWPSARIMWGGTDEQGVHISIGGAPLAALEAYGQQLASAQGRQWALDTLIKACQSTKLGWYCTRLDVALDNEKLSTTAMMMQKATGGLITRLQREEIRGVAKQGFGTFYLGSREGETYVRCYDKAGHLAGGDTIAYRDLAPWHRLEVEFKAERAQRLLVDYISRGQVALIAAVDSVVSFRVKDGDANPTRRERQDWWQAWCGVAPHAPRPPKPKRLEDLEVKMNWLAYQAGATMRAYVDEYGLAALHSAIDDIVTFDKMRHPHTPGVPALPTNG